MKGMLFKPWKIKFIAEHPDMELMTRRLGGLKEINQFPNEWNFKQILPDGKYWFQHPQQSDLTSMAQIERLRWLYNRYIKPRYSIGETVYIKEVHCRSCYNDGLKNNDGEDFVCYQADLGSQWKGENPCVEGKWTSPMMMPEWAARRFIKITDVRAERLQEITEQDIIAEGFDGDYTKIGYYYVFGQLWNSINKEKWEDNPWVWVYSFKLKDSECLSQKRH